MSGFPSKEQSFRETFVVQPLPYLTSLDGLQPEWTGDPQLVFPTSLVLSGARPQTRGCTGGPTPIVPSPPQTPCVQTLTGPPPPTTPTPFQFPLTLSQPPMSSTPRVLVSVRRDYYGRTVVPTVGLVVPSPGFPYLWFSSVLSLIPVEVTETVTRLWTWDQ